MLLNDYNILFIGIISLKLTKVFIY